MPSSENTDMIRFNGLDVQPRLDIDYTFELLDTDTLKLTYKKDFLQAHEWGEKDLGASIILYAEDGRKFNKPYSFNIKSNTPPPPLNVVLAKTTTSPEQYVLCLYVSPSEMSKKIGEELLHKDIAEIEINDTSYALTVNGTKNDFVKPAEESFIASGNVTKLMEANAKDLPTGSWILYYKTGRNIGSGSFLYTIKLKDEKGLTSTLETATTLNMPADETVDITQGSQDSESGSGTEESPFIIKPGTGTQEARIKISCATDNTTVYCTVTDTVTASTSQHSGAKSVTVLLALKGADDEKLYKVEYQTKGDGFSPTTLKTKYYKILKLHTVTFDANGGKFPVDSPTAAQPVLHGRKVSAPSTQPAKDGYVFAGWYKEQEGTNKWEFGSENVTGNMTLYAKWTNNALIIDSTAGAWKKLKEGAAKSSGVSVIVIKGEIKATSGDDSGQIEVNRNLTIQGNAGDGTDKLNAAGLSRIFRLESGIKLTLENLTLTGGKTTGSALEGSGGAIYSEGEVILENCKIENCYAIGDGGAIYSEGALTLNGCTIGGEQYYDGSESGKTKGNTASIGGGIYVASSNGEKKVSVTGTTISNNTAIHQGGGINFISDSGGLITADLNSVTVTNNKLTDTNSPYSNGGGIYTKGGTLNMTGCTVTGNNAVLGGGGIYVVKNGSTPAAVKIKGGTIEENTVSGNASKGHGGGIHISENCTLTMKDNVKINGNTARYDGGGIYAYGSTVVMENCTVTGNTAQRSGGGIYTKGGGTVNMTGCTIGGSGMEEGNTAGDSGGGVYSGQSTTVTMSTCSVMGNKAKSGGGIYAEGTTDSAKSTVTITDCTIGGTDGAGNKATGAGINSSGGGIYVVQYADVTLNGTANVIGNTADSKGGGVYVKDVCTTFTMSGGAKVDTATADNDVYLESGAKITVNGALSNAQAACITPQTYAAVTQVLNGTAVGAEHTKFAVTQTNGNVWRVGSDGKLKLNTVTVSGETSEKWKNLKKAVNDVEAGGTIIIDGEVKATNATGNNGEITIDKNLTIKKADSATSAVLDANGQAHRILKITGNVQVSLEKLTLQNGKETTWPGTGGSGGGGIFMEGTAHLQLTGVTIRNCTSKAPGGGLRMDYNAAGGGTLTMKDCKVINNTVKDDGGIAESSGGGIGLPNCPYTAVIDTCEISGNKVDVSEKTGSGSRIIITACGLYTGNKPNSRTEIKGHTVIYGNSYVKHGTKTTWVSGIGIWMQGGVVNIGENGKPDSESPVIRNHKVGNADEVHGTAIYLEGSAKVNWLSGHITDNGGPAAKAVYVRTGYGTPVFNNESGNTAN